jgi:hypothetical protein
MVGNIKDLTEMWHTFGICYNKPEKLMAEATELMINVHRCKAFNCAVIQKLYLLLMSTILSA